MSGTCADFSEGFLRLIYLFNFESKFPVKWTFNVVDFLLAYMCVSESGPYIVLPQQVLNKPNINSIFHQMSRITVSKRLERKAFW